MSVTAVSHCHFLALSPSKPLFALRASIYSSLRLLLLILCNDNHYKWSSNNKIYYYLLYILNQITTPWHSRKNRKSITSMDVSNTYQIEKHSKPPWQFESISVVRRSRMCICNDLFLKDQNSIKDCAFFKSIVVLYLEDFEYDESDLVTPPNKWITSTVTTIETCRNPRGKTPIWKGRGCSSEIYYFILFICDTKITKNIGKEEKKKWRGDRNKKGGGYERSL